MMNKHGAMIMLNQGTKITTPSSHRLWVKVYIATCMVCCGLFSAALTVAQPEKYVTVFLESNNTSAYDLAKIQKRVSNTLAKSGVTALVFNKEASTGAQHQRFASGESAKIKVVISPGTVIKGDHFSSFPVAIDMTVYGANLSSTIGPIVESARSQHTNNVAGLTGAISKALDKGLNKIGSEIAKLEPQDANDNRETASVDNTATLKTTPPTPTRSTEDFLKTNPKQDIAPCDRSVKRSILVISPATVINRGESLTIISCYRTESDNSQQVRIKTTIDSKNNTKRALLNSKDFVLASGYWKSSFNFDVPNTIAPGAYTLTQTIYRQGRVEYLKSDITIK